MSDLTLTHNISSDGSTLKISVTGRLAIDTAPALRDEQVARVWQDMVTIAPTLDQDGWKI